MKKIYILAAIALVAGVSCTKQVPVTDNSPDVPISFSPISQKAGTKAVVYGEQNATYTAQNASSQFEEFAAWAYFTTGLSGTVNPQTNTDATKGSAFFGTATAGITCNHKPRVSGTGTDYWSPKDEEYYWPKSGYLHFHALSPAVFGTGTLSHAWASGFGIAGYAAPVYTDNNTSTLADDNQIDLLYSDFVFDRQRSQYNASANVGLYDDEDDSGNWKHDGVDLTFRHALSTVLFRVKTDKNYKTATANQQHEFIVRKIEVLNAYNTGTFAENRTNDATNHYVIPTSMTDIVGMYKGNAADANGDGTGNGTPFWSSFSNEVTLTPYDVTNESAGTGAEATKTSGTTQVGQTLIALPQILSAGNAVQVRVTFEYKFSSDNGSTWSSPFTQTLTINLGGAEGYYNGEATTSAVNHWLINHKYVYTLVFKLDPVIFDPAVEAFVTVDDITVELPQA